jgi:hypothetical protein
MKTIMSHGLTNLTSICEGIPKDSEWLDMDASDMDTCCNVLSEKQMGISRRFVFNVDETGCSEHLNSHEATVVLPIDYPDPLIPLPVNRHPK